MNSQHKANGKDAKWYFTIVQSHASGSEKMVGFQDPDTGEQFIPAFHSKEAASACFFMMPKDPFDGSYDAQAVIEDDLISYAREAGHKVYLLDEKGTILDHIDT